jgi:hypothetical protein
MKRTVGLPIGLLIFAFLPTGFNPGTFQEEDNDIYLESI